MSGASGARAEPVADAQDSEAQTRNSGRLRGLRRRRRDRKKEQAMVQPDDRYVPIREVDLIDAFVADEEVFGAVSSSIRDVSRSLSRVIGQEASSFREGMDRRYEPVDPDRETLSLDDEPASEEVIEELEGRLRYLLEKANFERLEPVQIEAAINMASSHGLNIVVRPELVQRFELYVRGKKVEERRVLTRRRPLRGEPQDVEIYRRLAVIFQLSDSSHVNLKLFREVPVNDLESLFPHAEVSMGWFDRLKIIGGGAGALGGLLRQVTRILAGGAVAMLHFLWVVIVALFTLSMRSFFGYRNAKIERNSQMTHLLYYQNVANNGAVLQSLVHSIHQEEAKEVLLAYAFLAADSRSELTSVEALDERIESWLADRFGVHVNFDCPDALETLDRFNLWRDRGSLRLLPPHEAMETLERHWCEQITSDYHESMASGRRPTA